MLPLVDASKPYSNALKKKYPWSPDPKWSDLPDRELYSNRPDLQVIDNSICTSKYTLLSFIPKNLVEQFSKPANVYFLVYLKSLARYNSLTNLYVIIIADLRFTNLQTNIAVKRFPNTSPSARFHHQSEYAQRSYWRLETQTVR